MEFTTEKEDFTKQTLFIEEIRHLLQRVTSHSRGGRNEKGCKFSNSYFLFGCATIVSKSEWPVTITSTPEGADVTITDLTEGKKIYTGKTPTTVTLSSKGGYFKGKTYKVEIQKEGYTSQTAEIRSTLNGWYLGNILFGGPIGLLIVDPLTGAMWTLEPKNLSLVLEEKRAKLLDNERMLLILSIEDIPEHLRGELIKIN